MAISKGAIESALKAKTPFDRSNPHYKGDLMLTAIAQGVFTIFTTSATIIVNSGGGGTYPIIGVSAGGLEAAILSALPLNKSGKHAKANVMPAAAAKGIAAAISAATVSVPSMTSGLFPVVNFQGSVIKSIMRSELTKAGFDLGNKYSRAPEMIDAIASAVSSVVTSSARYPANGVSGGAFLML